MSKVGSSLGFIKLHNPPPIDPLVVKKIEEVDEILGDLEHVKIEFGNKLNPELNKHVAGIIAPMEQHLRKLQKKLSEQKLTENSEGWMLKAKVWTQLKDQPLHEAVVMSNIVTHIIGEVHSSIKQDFQVIQTYLTHRMEELHMSAEDKQDLHQKLQQPLADLSEEVRNLALAPAKATLDTLKDWRTKIDSMREKHQEEAFDLIDRHLPKKAR
jgi:delta 1-pyrroline-5-carboxylate dehydrogenase